MEAIGGVTVWRPFDCMEAIAGMTVCVCLCDCIEAIAGVTVWRP